MRKLWILLLDDHFGISIDAWEELGPILKETDKDIYDSAMVLGDRVCLKSQAIKHEEEIAFVD